MNHLSNWIEIPMADMARARASYEALLGESLVEFPSGHLTYAMFPTRDRHNAGALVMGEGYVPSREGAVVYLDATGRLDEMLARRGGRSERAHAQDVPLRGGRRGRHASGCRG